MKTVKNRFLIFLVACVALVCSASEVVVLLQQQASEMEAPADVTGSELVAASTLAEWLTSAGYAPVSYLPQKSWQAMLGEASR